jgi:hypothetical protein
VSWFGVWDGGDGAPEGGYLVSDLIEEARTLIDDDHSEQAGWIKNERWITWLNWEMQELSERMVRMGLVRVPHTEVSFTGPTTDISDVLELVNVTNAAGQALHNAQPEFGAEPFWGAEESGVAHSFTTSALGDTYTIEVHPSDTATFTARYIPQPTYVGAVTQTVIVPRGFERRLVYGMASHALIKESATSAALERRIMKADAALGMSMFSRVAAGGPVVRNTRSPSGPHPHLRGYGRYRG